MERSVATQRDKVKVGTIHPPNKERTKRVMINIPVPTNGDKRKWDEAQSSKLPGPSPKIARTSKVSKVSIKGTCPGGKTSTSK